MQSPYSVLLSEGGTVQPCHMCSRPCPQPNNCMAKSSPSPASSQLFLNQGSTPSWKWSASWGESRSQALFPKGGFRTLGQEDSEGHITKASAPEMVDEDLPHWFGSQNQAQLNWEVSFHSCHIWQRKQMSFSLRSICQVKFRPVSSLPPSAEMGLLMAMEQRSSRNNSTWSRPIEYMGGFLLPPFFLAVTGKRMLWITIDTS